MKDFLWIFFVVNTFFVLKAQNEDGHTYNCIHHDRNILFRSNPSIVTIADAYTIPYVITVGESFKIAIKVDDPGITLIEILSFASGSQSAWRYKGASFTSLTLKDDGSQGDIKAKDKIFTIDEISIPSLNTSFPDHKFFRSATIRFSKSNGSTETQDSDLAFGVRSIAANTLLPIVKKINDSVQYSNYVFNVVAPKTTIINDLSKIYFKFLPDDRDFLMQSTTYSTPGSFPAGSFVVVNNPIKGVYAKNIPQINRSVLYGTNGTLKGFINFYYTHGMGSFLFVHEILHYWCCFLDKSLGLDDGQGHWSTVEWPSSGFGSTAWTNSLQKVTDSTYKIGSGNRLTYFNNMELYLMGLLPLDSVAFPIKYLKNQGANISFNPSDQSFLVKGEKIETVSKDAFISVMDIRSPGVTSSQKSFKTGMIVYSERLLTAKEISYYETLIKEAETKNQTSASQNFLGLNFFTASRGKASIDAKIANLTTPIDNLQNKSPVSIYPNPVNHTIYIKGSMAPKSKYEIYTISGSLIASGMIDQNSIKWNNNRQGTFIMKIISRNKIYATIPFVCMQ